MIMYIQLSTLITDENQIKKRERESAPMQFAASQDIGGGAPAPDVDWAEDVSQGVCRPGCTSDHWIEHGGTWCPSAILLQAGTHFVQVPPAKPGTILLSDEGEWQNTTIFNKECMVRASGSSQDAGIARRRRTLLLEGCAHLDGVRDRGPHASRAEFRFHKDAV